VLHLLGRIRSRVTNEPRPVRFLASRLLWRAGLSRLFTSERNGYRVRFFPSAVSAFAWANPGVETAEETFVARTLRPGDTYVDVGANVGLLALRAAATVGPTGRVIAVEAHPRTARFLRENVRLNGFANVRVIAAAVGEAAGEVAFQDRYSDDQNAVDTSGSGQLVVSMQPLDTLLPEAEVGRVALLKVDVEGFELWALRGGRDVLRRTDRVLIESWTEHAARFGYQVTEVFELLTSAGFTLHRFAGGELRPVPPDWEPRSCENVVGLRP
jgi:FkbM family methyltransferase